MKRLFQCVVVLVLLTSFLSLAGTTSAHAATRSTLRPNCGTGSYMQVNIYDKNGSGAFLGKVEIDTQCGSAEAWAWPQPGVYVNHLWVRDAYDNYVSFDFGGGQGWRNTGWWGVSTFCAYGTAIFQSGNKWGSGNTGCVGTGA